MSKFDLKELLPSMLAAMENELSENFPKIKSYATEFLERRKKRLEALADLRIHGVLNNEEFLDRLKDEEEHLEAELHALAVVNKANAQKAANAALEVLEKAVKTALGLIS
jgi:hypothetical protein